MPDPNADLRRRVVEESISWCLTPFHDCAGVKGVGADCAHLILRSYAAVGLVKDFNPTYAPQWFINRDEPRFLQTIAACGGKQIDPKDALPADILMYKFGRHAAHGAIIVDTNTIVHAYKPVGCVTLGSRRELLDRLDSAWSLF